MKCDERLEPAKGSTVACLTRMTAKFVVKLVLASEPATAELTTMTKRAFLKRLSFSAPRNCVIKKGKNRL